MRKHGVYWILKNKEDALNVKKWGSRYQTENNTLLLDTIESDVPFDEKGVKFESKRWFEPK